MLFEVLYLAATAYSGGTVFVFLNYLKKRENGEKQIVKGHFLASDRVF